MANYIPNRQETLELLKKYNESDSLVKHAFSVEAVLRRFARHYGEDEEKWGIIGLIHDLDYERYPDMHCVMTEKILREAGWAQDYIRAVISHGWGIVTDVEPENLLEKTLFAVDELTGLVTACALVRPSKSVMDLSVKSVMKKWKVKTFAAGANRDLILKGSGLLGKNLEDLIQITIDGLKKVHNEIGL